MELIDVHCHLENDPLLSRIESIVERAASSGITAMITNPIAPRQWDISGSLSEKYSIIKHSLGIHPWYIEENDFEALDNLPSLLARGAAAVGETGLDRRVDFPPFDMQEKFFTRQLRIAIDANLPVIVHCRGAFDDLKRIVAKNGMPEKGGVIHAFSGSMETAKEIVKLGFSMSVGGALTWKLSNRRKKGIQYIFPDHFLLETDSPDFVPVGSGFEYNEPSNIIYNLRAASSILGVDEETIAEKTTENAKRIFGL